MTEQRATAALEDDPLAGDSKYRVIARLGSGGMGSVYEAEHVALGLRVVIKLLHEHLVDCEQSVDRFRLEAHALARLDHPNLVRVTDFGITPAQQPYFVMERIAGRTLREELIERGAIGLDRALTIGVEALAGLAAAHASGLVHRDVKPANLFLCSGRGPLVKLLDFGVAKVAAEARGARSPLAPLAVPTARGAMVGTPRWLSPEQALGRPVDARTDVYAMGLVLHAMLCGRGPFDDLGSSLEIVRAHVERPPPPPSRSSRQPLPPELDAVVLCALAKRPADRFPSATAFAEALARVAQAAPRALHAATRLDEAPPAPPAPTEPMSTADLLAPTMVQRPRPGPPPLTRTAPGAPRDLRPARQLGALGWHVAVGLGVLLGAVVATIVLCTMW